MDAFLAKDLRVGDIVLYRTALHTIVEVAPWSWPPTFKLQGPSAADRYISHTLLYFPILLNPPEKDGPCHG